MCDITCIFNLRLHENENMNQEKDAGKSCDDENRKSNIVNLSFSRL